MQGGEKEPDDGDMSEVVPSLQKKALNWLSSVLKNWFLYGGSLLMIFLLLGAIFVLLHPKMEEFESYQSLASAMVSLSVVTALVSILRGFGFFEWLIAGSLKNRKGTVVNALAGIVKEEASSFVESKNFVDAIDKSGIIGHINQKAKEDLIEFAKSEELAGAIESGSFFSVYKKNLHEGIKRFVCEDDFIEIIVDKVLSEEKKVIATEFVVEAINQPGAARALSSKTLVDVVEREFSGAPKGLNIPGRVAEAVETDVLSNCFAKDHGGNSGHSVIHRDSSRTVDIDLLESSDEALVEVTTHCRYTCTRIAKKTRSKKPDAIVLIDFQGDSYFELIQMYMTIDGKDALEMEDGKVVPRSEHCTVDAEANGANGILKVEIRYPEGRECVVDRTWRVRRSIFQDPVAYVSASHIMDKFDVLIRYKPKDLRLQFISVGSSARFQESKNPDLGAILAGAISEDQKIDRRFSHSGILLPRHGCIYSFTPASELPFSKQLKMSV